MDYTVEVLVVLAKSFDGLLCFVDLGLDSVALGGVVTCFLLPALRLRLLFSYSLLPLVQSLVELSLAFLHLRVGRLSLQPRLDHE